ncbi:Protein of unknown function DUF1800 [Rhabdaerophilaceae bacterium]
MSTPDEQAVLALHRFGLGGKPGSRAQVAKDPRGACLAEIMREAALVPPNDLPTTTRGIQFLTEIEERRREMREARRTIAQAAPAAPSGTGVEAATSVVAPMGANTMAQPMPDPDEVRLSDVVAAEVRARFAHGFVQPIGFAERWAQFWSNHFCVAFRRGQILRGIAGAYEREALRPHVFGRFVDLLIAAETHPAMLHYLDQRQSIGPNSPAGRRQKRGLNENLAREILELHTLGVGGGYTQADVTAFAKVLTGWSITGRDENLDGFGGFVFAVNRHEPGEQKVLNRFYPDHGKEQGIAVLKDLARHPSTATFIATKIARSFVADAPPPVLVAKLAANFKATDGDLAALARTLLSADEAWSLKRTKLRTPHDFLMAVSRASGQMPERPQQIINALNIMGQPLWNPEGPNGHPDDVASIAAPRAIKTRMDIALQMARPIAARLDPRELAADLFGSTISEETQSAIARAETRPQGLAILFMSPELQRR